MKIQSIDSIAAISEINIIAQFLSRDGVKLFDGQTPQNPESNAEMIKIVERLINTVQRLKSLLPA